MKPALASLLLLLCAPGASSAQDSATAVLVSYDRWRVIAPPGALEDDLFGAAVAVSGETMVVGAPGDDTLFRDMGAVYVFERGFGGQPGWSLVTKIVPTHLPSLDDWFFGAAVAIDGDVIVVGGPFAFGQGLGSVQVYERDEGGPDAWGLVTHAIGVANFPQWNAIGLGTSVAVSGGTAVAGAPDAAPPLAFPAFPYVSVLARAPLGGWSLSKTIRNVPPYGSVGCDKIGQAVAIEGDRLVAGAPQNPNTGCLTASTRGFTHVFARDQGGAENWGLVASLAPPAIPAAAIASFGESLALSGERLASVYSIFWTSSETGRCLSIHEQDAGGPGAWEPVAVICGPLRPQGGLPTWGQALAFRGDELLIGDADGQGRVHVHAKSRGGPNAWGRVRTIHPPSDDPEAAFGSALAVEGNLVAIGASGAQSAGVRTGLVYLLAPAK